MLLRSVFLLLVALVLFTLSLKAQNASPAAPPAPTSADSPGATMSPSPTPGRSYPYRGIITVVDGTSRTFTVTTVPTRPSEKEVATVINVSDSTQITKLGQPATLADIVVKEEVRGQFWKKPDGSREAKLVKLGPKPEKKGKGKGSPSPRVSPSPRPSGSPPVAPSPTVTSPPE